MLIVSRKIGQSIVIPGIARQLQILSVVGSQVRIGISAPTTVPIRRLELDEQTLEEPRSSS